MRKILLFLLLLPVLCFSNKHDIEHMVFFGDSLSDHGNLYRFSGHIFPQSPPYFKGHFSNGHLWAEKLYSNFFPGRKDFSDYNYSVGGAGAILDVDAMFPYTLSSEVNNYLYLHGFHDKSKVLYVIWIGGNNYLRAPSNEESITNKVVNAITHQMDKLMNHGAKHFMILNMPELSVTPYSHKNGTTSQLEILTKMHNDKLTKKLAEFKLKHPDVWLLDFNVYSIFMDYYKHPEKVDIKYVDRPCLSGVLVGQSDIIKNQTIDSWFELQLEQRGISYTFKERQKLLSNPTLHEAAYNSSLLSLNSKEEQACDDYLFFDAIHPTRKVHNVLADFAIAELNKTDLNIVSQAR